MSSLRNVFGSFSALEASYKVEAIATHFKDTSNIYIPKTPFDKLNPGMELIKDLNKLRMIKREASSNEDNLNRSIRRSLKRGKHIIRCNDWDWFITFTFAEHRYDLERCLRRMEDWLENQKKRKGQFQYIVVIEFHKDGAIHFHALFQGYKGKIVPAINPNTGKQVRKPRPTYDLPAYTLGHVDAYKCGPTSTDGARLERYLNKLEKYLNKDEQLFSKLPNRKRYWHTRGLKQPIKEHNPLWFDRTIEPVWKNENEWGETRIYTRNQIDDMRTQFGEQVS